MVHTFNIDIVRVNATGKFRVRNAVTGEELNSDLGFDIEVEGPGPEDFLDKTAMRNLKAVEPELYHRIYDSTMRHCSTFTRNKAFRVRVR